MQGRWHQRSRKYAGQRPGHVVILKAAGVPTQAQDRFEAARGKADIKWRTNELMALLRGDD